MPRQHYLLFPQQLMNTRTSLLFLSIVRLMKTAPAAFPLDFRPLMLAKALDSADSRDPHESLSLHAHTLASKHVVLMPWYFVPI